MDEARGDGGAKSSGWTLSEGETLGGYRVIRPLGRGGMGEVYLAEHERMGKRYALKVILPEHAGEEGFQQRFALEARVMADLEHPNIVRVHYMGEEGGLFFLAMDPVEGPEGRPQSLHDLLAEKGKLPEAEARRIVLEIARALDYAHSFQDGIVHRDLKPGNILLDGEGRVKVSDFGLARVMGEGYAQNVMEKGARLSVSSARTVAAGAGGAGLTQSDGAIVGTFEYMAPEQEEGRADARSDIYSLGLILYKMLTGRRARGAFDMPSEVGCSAGWDAVVKRCLRQRPEDRYQSASELVAELEAAAPAGAADGRTGGGKGLIAAAGVLALGGVAVTALVLFAGKPSTPTAPAKDDPRLAALEERLAEAERAAEAARKREAEAERRHRLQTADDAARAAAQAEASRKAEEESAARAAEVRRAGEAVVRAREAAAEARFADALKTLDDFVAGARFEESRRIAAPIRDEIARLKADSERLTAADLVVPRLAATEALAQAKALSGEPWIKAQLADVEAMLERADAESAAGRLPSAMQLIAQCRNDADNLAGMREEVESCGSAVALAEKVRRLASPLSKHAEAEFRVAEDTLKVAEETRSSGRYAEAARACASARGAFELVLVQAVKAPGFEAGELAECLRSAEPADLALLPDAVIELLMDSVRTRAFAELLGQVPVSRWLPLLKPLAAERKKELLLALPLRALDDVLEALPEGETPEYLSFRRRLLAKSPVSLKSLGIGGERRALNPLISPDGRFLAGWDDDVGFAVWDLRTGGRLPLHGLPKTHGIYGFSPCSRWLLVDPWGPGVCVCGMETGTAQYLGKQERGGIEPEDILFSADGKHIASVATDGSVVVRDAGTFASVATFTGRQGRGEIGSLKFLADGRHAATLGSDGSIALRDVTTLTAKAEAPGRQNRGVIGDFAFSPDGRYCATGASDGSVALRDGATLKELKQSWQAGAKPVVAVEFLPEGAGLLVSRGKSSGKTCYLDSCSMLSVPECDEVWTIAANGEKAILPTFTPDGRFIVRSARKDEPQGLHLHDPLTGKEAGVVPCGAISPTGRILGRFGSSDRDGFCVSLFDIPAGKHVADLRVSTKWPGRLEGRVQFTADGRHLLVGRQDGHLIAVPGEYWAEPRPGKNAPQPMDAAEPPEADRRPGGRKPRPPMK